MIRIRSHGRGGPHIPPETWWGKFLMAGYLLILISACVGMSIWGWMLVVYGWKYIGYPAAIWMAVVQIPLAVASGIMIYMAFLTVMNRREY